VLARIVNDVGAKDARPVKNGDDHMEGEHQGNCIMYFRAPDEADGCGFVSVSYTVDEVGEFQARQTPVQRTGAAVAGPSLRYDLALLVHPNNTQGNVVEQLRDLANQIERDGLYLGCARKGRIRAE
jgi:hypothetical protein